MKKILAAAVAVVMAAITVPALAAPYPFSDVPAAHWSYDAVTQLAARGIVSGYPDASYRGASPMTRFEMASIVARALAYMETTTAYDRELMRRLALEFRDELTAFGLKIDELEARLGALPEDLGGWRISGALEFFAKFGRNSGDGLTVDGYDVGPSYYDIPGDAGKSQFLLNNQQIDISKRISDTTGFQASLSGDGQIEWDNYYITTQLPWNVMLDVGHIEINWEDDIGLVGDDSPFVGDWTLDGFQFSRDWGIVNARALVARTGQGIIPFQWGEIDGEEGWILPEEGRYWKDFLYGAYINAFLFGANVNVLQNENLEYGALAYYSYSDENYRCTLRNQGGTFPYDVLENNLIWGVYAKFRIIPSIEAKGLYYQQHQSWLTPGGINTRDVARAWKVIIAADQELLKFTSLQLEYSQIDTHFVGNDPYGWGDNNLFMTRAWRRDNSIVTKTFGVTADQTWGDSGWSSWQRYYTTEYGCTNYDRVNNYGAGIGYQLNPAVSFELAYDFIDFGKQGLQAPDGPIDGPRNDVGSDHLVRFSTYVSF